MTTYDIFLLQPELQSLGPRDSNRVDLFVIISDNPLINIIFPPPVSAIITIISQGRKSHTSRLQIGSI